MKRAWLLAVAVAVTVVLGGAAQAEMVAGQATMVPRPTLQVNGTGTVQVAPDTVRVTASIISEGSTVERARERNAQVAQRAMKAVEALKLRNVAMKTADYTMKRVTTSAHVGVKPDLTKMDIPWDMAVVKPQSDVYGIDIPVVLGYQATNSITVRVQGVPPDELSASASKIIDALMGAGTNEITSVTYSLEQDSSAARREALAKAVKEAQATAQVVADAAGRKIVGIRNISPAYWLGTIAQNRVQSYANAAMGPETATPLATGSLEVSAQVQITYELEYNAGDTEFLSGGE